MTEKPLLDLEERIFTLSDVKRLYIKMQMRLLKWAMLGACLAFFFCGLKSSPKYKVEATFKEGADKSGTESIFKEMLGGMGGAGQPEAATVMKSHRVLRPVVEKLGLQASVSGNSRWLIAKVFKRLKENLQAEGGKLLADVDSFVFEDVFYEGDKAGEFSFSFTDPEHFVVYSSNQKTELCKSILGEKVVLPEMQFILSQSPSNLKIGKFYTLHISPWLPVVQRLRGELQVSSDKSNKSIYNLSFLSRDRYLGKRLINELMNQYQIYLKREHDLIAQEQLDYLENKQEQIYGKMKNLFDEHAAYLGMNLKECGFIALQEAVEGILKPHQMMESKVLDIDVELSRIDQIQKEGKSVSYIDGPLGSQISALSKEIQELKQQRDLLELSLCQIGQQALEERRDDLKGVRTQRLGLEKLIREVDHGNEISFFDLNPGLALWASSVQNPEEKKDLVEYLENYARLLSVREKMLQERFFYSNKPSSELEGIDLLTARQLFVQYNTKLDEAEATLRHLDQFKKELQQPGFELGSLSAFLNDPLSQKLIADASSVILRLKDEKYRSAKEGSRWEEELSLQRTILSDHLDQLVKVEELNASLIREKISFLQKVSLDCMNQKISILNEQMQNGIKERRQAIVQEKQVLEKNMEEMRAKWGILPEKWRLEKWLELKTDLVTKMMTTITEVVESKTITNHLHRVGSKPLDCAVLPLAPQPPRLFTMTFLGAFSFAFAVFFFALFRQILRGFPTTYEKLEALRLPVLGSISSFCDGPSVEIPKGPDLELLRNLALFAEGGKVIGLIGGKGPDYSYALAENLARTSVRSLILRCDWSSKFQKEDCPGLLQVWKRETADLPIRKGRGFDYMTAGGYTPFGTEIIQSQSFHQLVEILKKNYDRVFILLRAPILSAESIAALRICDKAAVTVSGEPTEELKPFINWAYHEDQCRLTFITQG